MELGILMLLIVVMGGLLLLVVNIMTSIWAYRDANRKGKSSAFALVVLIGTLFFPLVGLIVYIIIRND